VSRIQTGRAASVRQRVTAGAVAFAMLSLVLMARAAHAQILRNPIPLPPLSKLDTNLGVDPTLRNPLPALSPRALNDLRVLRIRTLVRAHSDVLESDPHGDPIVRHELLVWSPTAEALARAATNGFSIARRVAVDEANELVVLAAPAGIGTHAALKRLRRGDPAGTYEFNHVLLESGDVRSPSARAPDPTESTPTDIPARSRVGLVDAGVDAAHPVFAGLVLQRWGCSEHAVPSVHGTAVASLLAGRSGDFRGAAAGAELYAADVFCGAPTGGATDAVVAALGWLLHERVPVINVSLVGPPNSVLEQVVQLVLARGAIVVAAVGNDGPAAPAAYPASYPGVIAVTAVDARRHLLLEAGRALHVDLAAPGADMLAASPPSSFSAVRGTSFAAPLVAGLLARELASPDPTAARSAIEHVEAAALPLTDRVPASRYGKGVVGESLRVPVPSAPDGRKPPAGSF
jgi:subtilase family protein